MQVSLQAVRMYGSGSYYGIEKRLPAHGSPLNLTDCPQAGDRVLVHLGTPLEDIFRAEKVRRALGAVAINRLFGQVSEPASHVDVAVEGVLDKDVVGVPDFDKFGWFVTIIIERDVVVSKDELLESRFLWLNPSRAVALQDQFQQESETLLDLLTTFIVAEVGQGFFETLLVEDVVYFAMPGREMFGLPRFKLTGSLSVGKKEGFQESAGLAVLLGAVRKAGKQEREFLARVQHWYVSALTERDPWKRFQWSFLALEVLTNEMAPRLYPAMIDNLRVVVPTTENDTDTVPVPSTLILDVSRLTLLQKFTVMALALAPESAAEDVATFSDVKRARDNLAHGDVRDPAELPTSAVQSLLGRYLPTAVRSQFPLEHL